jgi:transcriptional regulator with XRE-family HTH domain
MKRTQTELFKPTNRRISENVGRLIKKRGWTIEKLALEADLANGNLYNMMNGKINFTLRAITRIEQALQVDVSELFKK